MIKKPPVFSLLVVVFIFLLVSAAARTSGQAGIQSRASHAERLWQTSGHADASAEAFTHWDEDGAVEQACAKCHSTPGFQDFIADGAVDSTAPLGTTVECEVCHTDPGNGIVRDHDSVTFPSGRTAENLGPEAMCMECHQGRASTLDVEQAIAGAAADDDDTVSPALRFINIHYYAAAANQFGTLAKGGYEYTGRSYDARFSHVTGYNACTTCHSPHSLEVDLNACATCHSGIDDPRDIRYFGSFVDYDGDGDLEEGMAYEIAGLTDHLYAAIRSYSVDVLGYPIVYDSHAYPYFFLDVNNNGSADPEEANYGNRYTYFSNRLLKAAYNYQVALKDPAGFAHGGKYLIQIVYDSLEDLNRALPSPMDISGLSRVDEGHFDGSAEAFRHWDEDGEVEEACARCHSAVGLAHYLETGEEKAAEIANGMLCTTCHTSPPRLRASGPVMFPSGVEEDMGDSSNLCLNCHQGRASKFSVWSALAAGEGPYRFINIHYYPTAAVLFGSEVSGGYEYGNRAYVGQKQYANHLGNFDTCVECHMASKSKSRIDEPATDRQHNVQAPDPASCVPCHGQDVSQPSPGADPARFTFTGIRPGSIPDYDGDGIRSESLKDEINGLEDTLYEWIKRYGLKIGKPIVYDSHAYPYFFNDLNGNGEVDPGEAIYPNLYLFDARLLKAAYNYQMSRKEPNGFVHNSRYIAQLLVDSIVDLGGKKIDYAWRF